MMKKAIFLNTSLVENMIKKVSLKRKVLIKFMNSSFGYGGYCLPKDTKQEYVWGTRRNKRIVF